MTSIIKPYTNKTGHSHEAHFSPSGKYLGSVAKLGPTPFEMTPQINAMTNRFSTKEKRKPVMRTVATQTEDTDDSDDELVVSDDSDEE
jgi:hypothetical protein